MNTLHWTITENTVTAVDAREPEDRKSHCQKLGVHDDRRHVHGSPVIDIGVSTYTHDEPKNARATRVSTLRKDNKRKGWLSSWVRSRDFRHSLPSTEQLSTWASTCVSRAIPFPTTGSREARELQERSLSPRLSETRYLCFHSRFLSCASQRRIGGLGLSARFAYRRSGHGHGLFSDGKLSSLETGEGADSVLPRPSSP